jgi:hypothetical protein
LLPPAAALAIDGHGGMLVGPFFDWRAPINDLWSLAFGILDFGICRVSGHGGVPDSTLGWIPSLPVEDEGSPRKSSFKKIIGNYEEMPLAA